MLQNLQISFSYDKVGWLGGTCHPTFLADSYQDQFSREGPFGLFINNSTTPLFENFRHPCNANPLFEKSTNKITDTSSLTAREKSGFLDQRPYPFPLGLVISGERISGLLILASLIRIWAFLFIGALETLSLIIFETGDIVVVSTF